MGWNVQMARVRCVDNQVVRAHVREPMIYLRQMHLAVLTACISVSLLPIFYLHFRSLVAVRLDTHIFHGHKKLQPNHIKLGLAGSGACQASCSWNATANKCHCSSRPPTTLPTYTITSSKALGAGRDLQLSLVQQTLPEYGPDFEQLDVQIRDETPVRLHVKISPTGVKRWEVPQSLLPRPGSVPFPANAARYNVQLPQEGQPFSFTVARCSGRGSSNSSSSSSSVGSSSNEGNGCVSEGERNLSLGGGPVFDTSGYGLVFKDQYLELTTRMQSATSLYGLGQRVSEDAVLKLPRQGERLVLWNYDSSASRTNVNQYGSHPFYLQVDADGKSSGVLLLNSNGMEVTLQETTLTYRVLGGVFDLYFFMGPSPESVMAQYQAVVGRPAMPPLWSLGFHHSRWGYRSLGAVKDVVARYAAAAIPLEVVWSDIDHIHHFRDFTFDPERFPVNHMKEFVASLHASGQRWVPIIDCGIPVAPDEISYQQGLAADVFIKDVTGKPYLGQVWPGATHYPDFLSVNRTWPWWHKQLQRMYKQVPFDGLWIDMNEASNFCSGEVCVLHQDNKLHQLLGGSSMTAPAAEAGTGIGSSGVEAQQQQLHDAKHGYLDHELDMLQELTTCHLNCQQPQLDNSLAYPPYAIAHGMHGATTEPYALGKNAIAMSAVGVDGQRQYDAHNVYGLSEAAATHSALVDILGKRPFLLTRSTFSGSGRVAAHWSGDNNSSWADLRQSVASLINSNMQGMALAGSDICGFLGNATEELCARWMSVGAFYTFSRSHNSLYSSPQEPYLWPSVTAAARKALSMRYRLLPHLYTWFYKAHVHGGTVAKPLFFPFPGDTEARNVADQWLLGDSVLVSPILEEGMQHRKAYFPAGTWYDLWTYSKPVPKQVKLAAAVWDIPLHLRGGSIITMQQAANTTAAVRASPVTLVLALEHTLAAQDKQQERCNDMLSPSSSSSPSPPAAAADARKSRSLKDAGSRSLTEQQGDGMQLVGCGMLYMDDGDSLEVPAKHGHLLLHFTAMATPNFSRGWIKAVPAAAVAAAGASAGGAAAAAAAAAARGRRHLVAGSAAATAAGMLDVPKLQEVLILGLGAAGTAAVEAAAAAAADGAKQTARVLHAFQAGGFPQDKQYANGQGAGGGHAASILQAQEVSIHSRQVLGTAEGSVQGAAAAGQGGKLAAGSLPPGAAYIVVPEAIMKANPEHEVNLAKASSNSTTGSSNTTSSSSSSSTSEKADTNKSSSSSSGAAVSKGAGTGAINAASTDITAASNSRLPASSVASGGTPGGSGGGSDPEAYHYHFDTYYDEDGKETEPAKQPRPVEPAAQAAAETKKAAASGAQAAPAPHVTPHESSNASYHYHYHSYYDHDDAAGAQASPAATAAAQAADAAAASTAAGGASSAAAGAKKQTSEGTKEGSAAADAGGFSVSVDGQQLAAGQVLYDAGSQVLRIIGLERCALSKGVLVEWGVGKPQGVT